MTSTAQKSAMALIVAAGNGTRAGGGLPKQYRRIGGEAVIARAFDALAGHPDIAGVHIVIGADQEDMLAAALDGRQPASVSPGGATRRDSVLAGLRAIAAHGAPAAVLIHDAARPFLPAAVIDRLLGALETQPGAVPTLAVVDTLVRSEDGALGDTVPREGLARADAAGLPFQCHSRCPPELARGA